MEFAGSIVFDDKVWQSIRLREPFTVQFPSSMAAQNISAIADSLRKDSEELVGTSERKRLPTQQLA